MEVAGLVGFAIVISAVILNFSRAGLVILVGGSAAWVILFALHKGSTARVATALSILLLLLPPFYWPAARHWNGSTFVVSKELESLRIFGGSYFKTFFNCFTPHPGAESGWEISSPYLRFFATPL